MPLDHSERPDHAGIGQCEDRQHDVAGPGLDLAQEPVGRRRELVVDRIQRPERRLRGPRMHRLAGVAQRVADHRGRLRPETERLLVIGLDPAQGTLKKAPGALADRPPPSPPVGPVHHEQRLGVLAGALQRRVNDRRAAVERVDDVERPSAQILVALPDRPGIEAGARSPPQHARSLNDLHPPVHAARQAPLPGRRRGHQGHHVPLLHHVSSQVEAPEIGALTGHVVVQHQDAHTASRRAFLPPPGANQPETRLEHNRVR